MTSPTPTSSPNIAPASDPVPVDPRPVAVRAQGSLTRIGSPSPIAAQVDQLQAELVESRDLRLEERFYLSAVIGLLIDLIAFMAAGVTAGLCIFLAYLAFLVVFSKRCGVEGVQETLTWAGSLVNIHGKGEKKDE